MSRIYLFAPLFAGTVGLGQPTASGVFTAAQAEAGKKAYERTCGQCHTPSLLGRKGDAGEVPPLSSPRASWQKFIGPRGYVAPLAGKGFLERYGEKTAAQMIARFQETVDDPTLAFEGLDEEATVNITAYVLQVNGAKTGSEPLTRTTGVVVNSVVR